MSGKGAQQFEEPADVLTRAPAAHQQYQLARWLDKGIAPKGNATAVALKATDHMIGNEVIAQFLSSGMHQLFQDVRIDFRSVVADGDTVVVEEKMSATLPSGKAYENDHCFFFTLHHGEIKQIREYMDTNKGHQTIFG